MDTSPLTIRQMPFGYNAQEGLSHAVFVCLFARNCAPYDVDNPEIPDEIRSIRTNKILLFGRHDDTIGWPGGSSEKSDFEDRTFLEGLRVAAQRETKQETGFDIECKDLMPICSHFYGDTKLTHLFGYEVSYEALLNIAQHIGSDESYFAETTGLTLSTTLTWPSSDDANEYDVRRGIFARFQQPSPPAFAEELYQVLSQCRLVDIDVLKAIEREFFTETYMQQSGLIASCLSL